jgi:hypothetical protein
MTSPKFPADVPRGHAALERAAARIRRQIGFGLADPVNWVDVLAGIRRLRAKAAGVMYLLDYHYDELAAGVEAETRYCPDPPLGQAPKIEIVLSNETGVDLEACVPRALFSLLHELGHAVLHTAEVIRRSASTILDETAALLRGRYSNLRPYLDVEWQANVFASCHLMPAIGLAQLEERGQLTPNSVCECYGASLESATYRISTFQKRRGELMKVYS